MRGGGVEHGHSSRRILSEAESNITSWSLTYRGERLGGMAARRELGPTVETEALTELPTVVPEEGTRSGPDTASHCGPPCRP